MKTLLEELREKYPNYNIEQIKPTQMKEVSVAPSSTHEHYVKGAIKVINLDEVNETFKVEGASVLETSNHTTLDMPEDCIITCQTVFNPFEKMYQKSKD